MHKELPIIGMCNYVERNFSKLLIRHMELFSIFIKYNENYANTALSGKQALVITGLSLELVEGRSAIYHRSHCTIIRRSLAINTGKSNLAQQLDVTAGVCSHVEMLFHPA